MKGKVVEGVTIYTNNVPRDLLRWYDLTDRERKQFDYIETEREREDALFFRYKGNAYDLGEFPRLGTIWLPHLPPAFEGWDSYASDSFFSGVLVKFANDENGHKDPDRVIVGWYCS